MASRQGSRKRQRLASSVDSYHTGDDVVPTPNYVNTPSSAMLPQTNPPPAQHEQALKSLNTDIEAMRSLVTCKVCNRLLYEPFSLSCGHTYCYSCLSSWMVNHSKKTCPDCRAHISQQPTPAYIVRELVLIFRNRNQLLPPGETVEEHQKLAEEEAKTVTDARANNDPQRGGLFQGVFAHGRRRRLQPIYDPGDNVLRCPDCNWELEDGWCLQCGREGEFDDLEAGELDLSDDDLESDVEIDDLDGHPLGLERGGSVSTNGDYYGDSDSVGGGWRRTRDLSPHEEENTEDSDVDAGGNLRSFVVHSDDDELEGESSDDGEDTDVPPAAAHHRRLVHRRPPIVLSDDDDDGDEEDEDDANTETGLSTTNHEGSVDYDSADDQPTPRDWHAARGHVSIPQHVHVLDSEDETASEVSSVIYRGIPGHPGHYYDEDDEDDEDEDDDGLHPALYGNFSPPQGSVDETSTVRSEYESDEHSNGYDDDDLEDDDEDEDGWDTRSSMLLPNAYMLAASSTYHWYSNPAHLQFLMPVHPFNLENTLARANYNQRALHARPVQGGYGAGNNVPVSRANARKRALSIASDESADYFN